jgi:hypothetical protein
MYPWMRRSEHALSVRRCVCVCVCLSCRPMSLPESSARLMVWEEGGGHQNFDACVRGMMGGSRSKGGGTSLFGAGRVYEILSVPSENTSCGGVGQCYALLEREGIGGWG